MRSSKLTLPTLCRAWFLAFASCTLAFVGSASVAAEDFAVKKSVSLMVPYPAGGPSDYVARVFSEPIGRELQKTVVVENLGGATGSIAANRVLSAPADGSYIFQGTPMELVLSPLTNSAVKFTPEDFQLVHPVTTSSPILLVRRGIEASTLDEFIQLARERKDEPLTYGSVGVGSMYHLIVEYIAKRTNMNALHVPYKGAGPVLQDLAGGQIDFAVLGYQSSMKGLESDGKIKILASLGSAVVSHLSGIQTVSESSILKNDALFLNGGFSMWSGYFVKRGTSPSVIDSLHGAVISALQRTDLRTKLEADGRIVFQPISKEQVQRFQQTENARFRTLIESVDVEFQ